MELVEQALKVYERIYDPESHFGKTIAIVQSSGMGKSRTMAELCQKVWSSIKHSMRPLMQNSAYSVLVSLFAFETLSQTSKVNR